MISPKNVFLGMSDFDHIFNEIFLKKNHIQNHTNVKKEHEQTIFIKNSQTKTKSNRKQIDFQFHRELLSECFFLSQLLRTHLKVSPPARTPFERRRLDYM